MGYWGGNNEDEQNALIEQQIQQNNAEIERERTALSERRLSIIKSQGAQSWEPSQPPQQPNRSEQVQKALFGSASKASTLIKGK